MTKIKIVKLYFTSPLHVGEIGIGLEESSLVLHSDTIFNAICNSLSKLYGSKWINGFLSGFSESVPFRISSGFPFTNNTLYFPKPMSMANVEENLLKDYSKKLKKTTYLTQDYFQKWIARDQLFEDDLKEITTDENLELCEEEASDFGTDFLLPKVSISRDNAESSIYFLGSVHFKKDSGIWFILDCKDKDYEEKVFSALRLLQHDGIGGKRTWGYGGFCLKDKNAQEIQLDVPNSDTQLLLSLFYPEKGEENLFSGKKARWGFSLRGGYAYPYGSKSSSPKPQRLFIKEGSIFEKIPKGKLLQDPTKLEGFENLYHYGFAYSIPINIDGGEQV
ncbi:type III-A CRISPR-associated RAMP protein Csm4 [Methanosarcina barkeri]|uniref:CRISPR system Cms protein Csm4 n=1 Tax=Methanosarcina barkeri CM1 TaxID=796385 RepID=A0A0G3CBW3_METBA|nr:type III-A CRISPR-associated RAMP protein Csm4 [Methanosarcina barkeri]AKJ39496.1 CRISPR-associated RAMP protein Csm4 [Methanosarcina barkeri CM1]